MRDEYWKLPNETVLYFSFRREPAYMPVSLIQPHSGHDNTLTRAGQRADRFIPRKKHSSPPSASKREANRKKRR
jgi:hypothetical protein